MKLKQLFESKFLTKKDDVIEWIVDNGYLISGKPIPEDKIEVANDGSVDLLCEIELDQSVKKLEVNFNSVTNIFSAIECDLESFDGVPKVIKLAGANVNFSSLKSTKVSTLDGITRSAEEINISRCPMIKSLKDIHKHINYCERIILPGSIQSNILGLLLIDGLKTIKISIPTAGSGLPGVSKELKDAINIIKKYLGQGRSGVVKAQRELMDADLDDFAEL